MRASGARTQKRVAAAAATDRRRWAIGDRLDRWEQLRRTADDSAARFGRAAERCAPGPLNERIDEVERRAQDIDTSLAAAVAVAFELALDSVHHDVGRGMDDLVAELGSLRDALAELRAEPDPTR